MQGELNSHRGSNTALKENIKRRYCLCPRSIVQEIYVYVS